MSVRDRDCLGGEMISQIGSARIAGCPAEAIGEVGGRPAQIRDDCTEGPIGPCDDDRLIPRPQVAQDDIDAGRLILTVPSLRQASGKTQTSGSMLSGDQPDDAVARPGTASAQKGARLGERCRDVRSQHRVGAPLGQVSVAPAGRHEARGRHDRMQAFSHPKPRLDGRPDRERIAHCRAELPTTRANIEQITDLRHGRAYEWGDARDVVGRIDPGCIEFEWVDLSFGCCGQRIVRGASAIKAELYRPFFEFGRSQLGAGRRRNGRYRVHI